MIATVDASALATALSLVGKATNRRVSSSMPIVGQVFLQASGGRLRLTATDLDVLMAVTIPATVVGTGEALLGCETLGKLAHSWTGAVTLRDDDDWVSASCGGSKVRLPTMPVGDYPPVPPRPQKGVAVPGKVLLDLLRKTMFVASTEASKSHGWRYVRVVLEGGRIEAVALDGHRLAIASAPGPDAPKTEALLDVRLIDLLMALEPEDEVEIAAEPTRIHLWTSSEHLACTLPSEPMPVRHIGLAKTLPPGYNEYDLQTSALAAALRRLTALVGADGSVLITLPADHVRLEVDSDRGNGVELLPTSSPTPGDGTSEFAVGYLSSVMPTVSSETVTLALHADPGKGAYLWPAGQKSDQTYLVAARWGGKKGK